MNSFNDFKPALSEKTLQVVKSFGFTKPTEVQQEVIPAFLSRKDVIVQSKTGSGKTLSYLIPVFEMISSTHPIEITCPFALFEKV